MKSTKYKEQIARVIHMEALCDEITEALASDDVEERLLSLKLEIKELEEYYEGPAWREDFDAERQDVFPKNLKRGILTEDTLYDLLCDVNQTLNKMDAQINCGNKEVLRNMELKRIGYDFTVCKVASENDLLSGKEFYFTGKTDEEISLVCITADTPENTIEHDDGWKAFRIQGVLDFSLIGILSKISTILAENKIGIFAISTFNTDYILVKKENYEKSLQVLAGAGYAVV